MKRITAVASVQVGQVLGADVRLPGGECLFEAGCELDAGRLAALDMKGVSSVLIELTDDDVRSLTAKTPTDEDPAARFVLNDTSHPIVGKLVEVAHAQHG